MIDRPKRGFMQFQDVRSFLDSVLSEDIHAKRVDSLANAALGVMTGASLAVAMIGRSLAQARGLLTKHAVKQVDRLLSNPGIEAWDIFATWVPEMVGSRTDIVVAMDWTDYDADGQATLALKLVTRHGRATPLVWLSVHKDELTDARNDYEDACVGWPRCCPPASGSPSWPASPTPSCSSSSASWASTTSSGSKATPGLSR